MPAETTTEKIGYHRGVNGSERSIKSHTEGGRATAGQAHWKTDHVCCCVVVGVEFVLCVGCVVDACARKTLNSAPRFKQEDRDATQPNRERASVQPCQTSECSKAVLGRAEVTM